MNLKYSWKWLVALGAVFVPGYVLGAVDLPNVFAPNTPIVAAEVNANFAELERAVEALEARVDALPAGGGGIRTPFNKAYWVWGSCSTSGCTVSGFYDYNPDGTLPTIARSSAGVYSVTFPGASLNDGIVQVSAYSSTARCNVGSWGGETVSVRCYAGNAVTALDSSFTVLVLR
ncbi:MAG: hypothetical protein KIT72_17125 [Polyangiaceae bacterium]|nr:hypothetical protein [Polyangiaceae bacterium]MCW5792141.1 hypothetical protein [Polyangiaceae bacterium]